MPTQKNKSVENKIKQLEMEISILRDAYFQLEKTKKDLIKSEESYKNIFNNSPESIILIDKSGKVLDVNQRFLDWLEHERDEIVGKNLLKLPVLSEEAKEETTKKLAQRFAGEDIPPYDLDFKTKSGQVKIGRITAALIEVQDQEFSVDLVMISDVTAEKESEKKVKELNELRHKFITIVSHQLRTPLNSIRWNLENLIKGQLGKLDKSQMEFLRLTHDSNVEVIRRLNELLAVINIEEGRSVIDPEETSLESLWAPRQVEIEKICDVKQIQFAFQAPTQSLPVVNVDSNKIRQVFDTFTRNATDYTKKEGKIDVKLELVDDKIRFEIHDTGIGIPKTDQSKIFKAFFRASNAFNMVTDASGVGLSVAKFYVEQHGGQIGFTSEENKGSTFWFELPVKNGLKKASEKNPTEKIEEVEVAESSSLKVSTSVDASTDNAKDEKDKIEISVEDL